MNGVGTRQGVGLEPAALSPLQNVMPSGRAIANGYREDAHNGFEPEKPRHNPLNPERPQSSPLVDLKDPIQVHLLTETALADSQEWEILSQEEVDDMKKMCQSITQRIEQTRANLAIQSKYRDAAISMTKLYSPTQTPGKRRSLLGNRGSGGSGGSDAVRDAEAERQACEKRCEELASELFVLEKRIMDPQRKLLQHTAGILQLTHKVSAKKAAAAAAANGQPISGIPGSPESMYTYSNGRESLEIVNSGIGGFDERSWFFPIDQPLDQVSGQQRNTIEIPLKSPVRKETMELREETDKLREDIARLQDECNQLRATNDSTSLELSALQQQHDDLKNDHRELQRTHEELQVSHGEHLQTVANTERQIEGLNSRLRSVIVGFNPEKHNAFDNPPAVSSEAGRGLTDQLQYLDTSLSAVHDEQQLAVSSNGRQAESEAVLAQVESRIGALNSQIEAILQGSGVSSAAPPDVTGLTVGLGTEVQLNWLQDALVAIESTVTHAGEAFNASSADREMVQQVDNVLMGLWNTIRSGFAEIQQRRDERKASRQQMGLGDDDEDVSDDESVMMNLNEPYSLQAFASKVEWLYAQTTKLKDHKSVLKRQIKQQRELNSKSDAERDVELQNKHDELQQLQRAHEESKGNLSRALADLSATQQRVGMTEAAANEAQERMIEHSASISALETQSAELRDALGRAETHIATLTAQLNEANETAEANAAQAARDVQSKDEELEKLNDMVVELKTEATIAKAELEGAYGSRRQRAADVAALAKSNENDELHSQVQTLKDELAGTLKEYEDMTKDTLSAEHEKLNLEAQLDDALSAKTSLETEVRIVREKLEGEVTALKEALDAERLKVTPQTGATGTSTRAGASMLSEQFRATMKEERKKFQEELRNEQMQRRKLEEEIRALKRAAGPGKSPLSPR